MKRRTLFLLFLPGVVAAARSKGCDEGGLCSDSEFFPRWNNFANTANDYLRGRKAGIVDRRLREHTIHRWKDLAPCL
jgi:hypothetical protein